MDEIDREMWAISENLHRADLTKEGRTRHLKRWAELLEKRRAEREAAGHNNLGSLEKSRGRGRPKKIASEIAKATGLHPTTVKKDAGRAPDTRAHDRIIALRKGGHSISETARLAGTSASQVKRVWTRHK
jgi:Helix-turn-helix domain of resolvase